MNASSLTMQPGVGVPSCLMPFPFSASNTAQAEGAALAEFAAETKKFTTGYVLLDDSIEYDKSLCAGYEWLFPQKGGKIAGRDTFKNADPTIAAQITQMVRQNKQDKGRNGDIAYNFTFGTKIERIYVTAAVREHIVAGRLVIVGEGGGYELVPRVIADKIAERNPEIVVRVKQASTGVDEDDPYADFKIPDDLMW